MRRIILLFFIIITFSLPSSRVIAIDNPVPIPTEAPESKKTIYRLLAPIPGLTCIDDVGSDKDCVKGGIGEYLNIIFKIGIGLCGVLAVVMLVINFIGYMSSESFTEKARFKEKFWGPIGGLLLALGAYAILTTINPSLTGKDGLTVDEVGVVVDVRDRADDINFIKNLDSFIITNVNISNTSYNDALFLGYLAHQQGVGGAAAILWSEKKGYAEVPSVNPFVRGDININMRSNFNTKSAQRTIGTSTLTPATFLKYWATKVAAIKNSVASEKYKVPASINDVLNKVSKETGVDIITLKTMCVIESGCSTSTQATTGTYVGLFAISKDVLLKYGKGGNILDPYSNAFAAAKLFISSSTELNKRMSKINSG